MKYIRTGTMSFRIFSDHESHVDIAREVKLPVVSAGFIRFDEHGAPVAYGESTSLGIKSMPAADTRLLQLIWRF